MKRFIFVLTAVLLLCGLLHLSAGAAEEVVLHPSDSECFLTPQATDLDTELDNQDLEEYLQSAMVNFTEEIDVLAFQLPLTQEGVNQVARLMEYELPECYHIASHSYHGYTDSPYIHTIRVTYSMTPQEYAADHAVWEKVTEDIVGDLLHNTVLTDAQKALLIHDRLALHCQYDKENYDREVAGIEGAVPPECYTAYGAMVDGIAVCEGYAKAYKYLLEQVDIHAFLCESLQIKHMWNIVEIDSKYYHVDVTWDDPAWDVTGRVEHKHFLCSTQKILENHTATDFVTPPTDNAYDNAFWRDSSAAFVLVGSELYYIDNDHDARVYTLNTYGGTVLCSVDDFWRYNESYGYKGIARLATDGVYLYYSLSDAIYQYDIAAATSREFYKPAVNYGPYFALYGFRYVDGTFEMVFHDNANFDIDTKSNYTVRYTPEVEEPEVEELFSLSGQIASQNGRYEITLRLLQNGSEAYTRVIPAKQTVGTVNDAFCITGVKAGTYDLVVSKACHFSYTVKGIVIAGDTDLTAHANPQIALLAMICGDITGDGCVDLRDVQKMTADNTFNRTVEAAENKEADINGDGLINLQDLILLTSSSNFNKGKTEVSY